MIKEMANNDTLFSAFGSAVLGPSAGLGGQAAGPGTHRQLLIMDEVDGMSGAGGGGKGEREWGGRMRRDKKGLRRQGGAGVV